MNDRSPGPSTRRPPVLILGGTTEAYALADALVAEGGRVISSLAGRTTSPRQPAGEWRVGGFGGPAGLEAYLRAEGIGAVIDATHPFARRMGWNAAAACQAAGVPLLRLDRPAWTPGPGDRWDQVDDWDEAVRRLDEGGAQRVLLALGRQELFGVCPPGAALVPDPLGGLPPTRCRPLPAARCCWPGGPSPWRAKPPCCASGRLTPSCARTAAAAPPMPSWRRHGRWGCG